MQVLFNIAKYNFVFILFLIFLPFTSVFATHSSEKQEPATDYFDLGLEELMNLDVSVASINSESIVKTPAIVSSYRIKDFEKMGLRSLLEVLSFIPGIMVQSGNNPTESIMVRGLSETFNQKILLLIDDVPYWGASHSQIPLLGIPLEAIEHIEVIRGPGAVIYGTNASAGVIKIVTKKADFDNTLAIRGGSHKHQNGSGFLSKSFSDSVDLSIAFEAQKEDGYKGFFENSVKVPFLPDSQETSGTIREKMEMKSILIKLRIDKLNLMAQSYESLQTGSIGAAPTHPVKPAQMQNNGSLLHADYTWDNDKSTIKAYTDYNIAYIESWESNYLPEVERRTKFASTTDTYRWRNGVTVNYHFFDNLSVFAGSEYEYRAVGDYDLFIDQKTIFNPLEKQNSDETSLFGQIDYQFDKFRFLIGTRYTDNEHSGSATTPRASIIYSFNPSESIKFLYSEGFNSPNFLQTNIDFPFLGGNPDLTAEIVKTLDIAYTYSNKHTLLVVNAYRLEANDLISRIAGETRPTYDNSGSFKRHGLELDLQHHQGNWQGFFNAAYIYEGNSIKNDDPEAFHTPELSANIALHYNLSNHHGTGTSLRYVGARSGINNHLIWNLDYQFNYKDIEVFATLKNLLSEAAFTRDVAGFSPEPVPVADPKINFLAGIKYFF